MISTKEKIKLLCNLNNLSLNKLEQDCGVAKGYISKLDKSSPSVENILKFAKHLNVTTDYLLNETSFVNCPICGYLHDPLSEDTFHNFIHNRYLKAVEDFGQVNTLEKARRKASTTLYSLKFHIRINKDNYDKFYELYDEYLDYEFDLWLWENNFHYEYSYDLKYRWKQEYIEKNLYPTKQITLDICNYIREMFFIPSISEDDKKLTSSEYDEWRSDEKFYNYIKRLWKLPTENRNAIYEQIDFQVMKTEK